MRERRLLASAASSAASSAVEWPLWCAFARSRVMNVASWTSRSAPRAALAIPDTGRVSPLSTTRRPCAPVSAISHPTDGIACSVAIAVNRKPGSSIASPGSIGCRWARRRVREAALTARQTPRGGAGP